MKTILLTVVTLIILVALGGLVFIYTGTYNVAATSRDNAILHWVLETTREESIDRRADDVIPPPNSVLSATAPPVSNRVKRVKA